jgi:tetratricopeptide (TPR) repeat protein
VAAARKADLEQQKESVTTNARDIGFLVRLAFADAKENEKYLELAAFYLELGLVEDALFYRNAQLSADYHLVNYFWSRDPYRVYAALRGFISDKHDGSVPDFDLLYELPGNYQLLSDLVRYNLNEDPLASAVVFLTLLPDSDGDRYAASLADLTAQLSRLNSHHQNFAEYIEMLGRLTELLKTEDTVFHQSPLLHLTLKTFGHLKMGGGLPSDTNHYFDEAHTLFTTGREPGRIEQLLVLSLTESPRHTDSWEHLAALLFWQEKVEEALVAYTQLYQLDNSNLETAAHIAECYDRLGFRGLSGSYADYLPILNQNIGNKEVIEIINRLDG